MHTKNQNISSNYPELLIAKDYFPYGMEMTGRYDINNSDPGEKYRFGFQGQESETEIAGVSGAYSFFKYRISNNRIGRFFAIDPLTRDYPYWSPYAFSGNRVIDAIEQEGLQPVLSQSKIEFYQSLPELKASDWKDIGKDLQLTGDIVAGVGLPATGTGVGALLIPYGRFLSMIGTGIEIAADVSLREYEEALDKGVSFFSTEFLTRGLLKGSGVKQASKEIRGIIGFGIEKTVVNPNLRMLKDKMKPDLLKEEGRIDMIETSSKPSFNIPEYNIQQDKTNVSGSQVIELDLTEDF